MTTSVTKGQSGCSLPLSRRGFLFTTGALAAAAELGLCNFVSSLVAADAEPAKKPLVRVAFARPKVDRDKLNYYWPGAAYDVEARQADYTRVLRSAADKLSVDLEILDAPLHDQRGCQHLLGRPEEGQAGRLADCAHGHVGEYRLRSGPESGRHPPDRFRSPGDDVPG